MTLALVLLIIALCCGIAALLGVASRVDLTAVGLMCVAIALLMSHFG